MNALDDWRSISMMEFDDQNWPLAIALFEQEPLVADNRSFLVQLSSWLDRGRPFVLLCLFVSMASAVTPAGAATETEEWLRENGNRLRSLVPGVAASVLNGWSGETVREDFFGRLSVPMRRFGNGLDAVAWFKREVLSPVGMRIEGL